MGRIAIEKKTVQAMIRIYCRDHKHVQPCASCQALEEYALKRLDRCPFGEEKPACKDCTVHCYKPAMREDIRKVMRYAGPRMLWHHPWLSIAYSWKKLINR